MAVTGPVPKRSDMKLGHTSKDFKESFERAPNELDDPLGPEPPEWLDGYAREFYESVQISGQAVFYTHSDWAALVVLCRGIMEFIRRPTAMMLGTVMSGMSDLVLTEGARRRVKIELGKNTGTEDPEANRSDQLTDTWYQKLKESNERRMAGLADPDDPDVDHG